MTNPQPPEASTPVEGEPNRDRIQRKPTTRADSSRRRLWIVLVGGLIILAGLAVVIYFALQRLRPQLPGSQAGLSGRPPVLFGLPRFELVNQRGDAFGTEQLRGKVWFANFFFTSCPTICPKLTRHMRSIQERAQKWGDRVHLVSFSVDPLNDTPAKMTTYAHRYKADTRTWTFLTGPLGEVKKAVIQGFKMVIERQRSPTRVRDGQGRAREVFDITHSAKVVLIDRKGRIRGYYDSNPGERERLLRHAKALVEARP